MTRAGRWPRASLAAWPLAALSLGCSSGSSPYYRQAELDAGDYRLIVDERPRVRLLRIDDELLRFDEMGLLLGLCPPVDDDTNYDPYRLWVPTPLYSLPAAPSFVPPVSAAFAGGDDENIRLAIDYGGGHRALLVATAPADGRFALTLTPTDGAADVAFIDLRAHASADEGFYGLGELTDSASQRGRIRAMQLELEPATEAGYNDAHAPVPLVIGTRGWGLFVQTRLPGAFALANPVSALAASGGTTSGDGARTAGVADVIEADFGVGVRAAQGLTFHLFGAAHPLDLLHPYYQVTGAPALPARIGYGPWIWRNHVTGQAQVESDADTLRALDLPASGYWLDDPYFTAVGSFDFDPKRFSKPGAMLAKLHAAGLATALWHVPYLDENSPATSALRAQAAAGGFYAPVEGLLINPWGKLLDLTNPKAVAWWQALLRGYTALGVDGFKLDYAEDVAVGLTAARNRWSFSDGSDERTEHAELQLRYHDAYRGVLPAAGGFLLARTGRYGDQASGAVIWPGDLDSDFAARGQSATDRGDGHGYVAAGGLPAAILAGLTLSASGFAFYASDTAGYRHAPPDAELYSRWFEYSALSTSMEIGDSANTVAWEPTAQNGFDAALLGRFRDYLRLHLRLFPYVWSYAERRKDDGRPIMRALGLAHPELGSHPNDEYLLGDELLVAPVVTRGASSREVVFPGGKWLHWFTGQLIDGDALAGAPAAIDAPIGRLPLFLRVGGIVPLLRPTIDTLAPVADPSARDSYATSPGILFARAVARASGQFALFDGGSLAQIDAAAATTLTFAPGAELTTAAIFELLAATAPAAVAADPRGPLAAQPSLTAVEQSGGWFYDSAASTLWVEVLPGMPVTVRW